MKVEDPRKDRSAPGAITRANVPIYMYSYNEVNFTVVSFCSLLFGRLMIYDRINGLADLANAYETKECNTQAIKKLWIKLLKTKQVTEQKGYSFDNSNVVTQAWPSLVDALYTFFLTFFLVFFAPSLLYSPFTQLVMCLDRNRLFPVPTAIRQP